MVLMINKLSVFVTRNESGFILSLFRGGYDQGALVTGEQTNEIYRGL